MKTSGSHWIFKNAVKGNRNVGGGVGEDKEHERLGECLEKRPGKCTVPEAKKGELQEDSVLKKVH